MSDSNISRYDIDGFDWHTYEISDGEWVLWDDVVKLAVSYEHLKASLQQIADSPCMMDCQHYARKVLKEHTQ